jgi:hypothetical protein
MTAEAPRAKATVTFQGIEVTATKDRLWHVEAAGRSASAAFLDQAVDLVLPRLSYEEQDSLLIRLLTATSTEQLHPSHSGSTHSCPPGARPARR